MQREDGRRNTLQNSLFDPRPKILRARSVWVAVVLPTKRLCCIWLQHIGCRGLKIPSGVGGVEYRLLVLFDRGVEAGRISLEQLVAITSSNPAKLFGLYPRKGSLMVGADADVVVLDPYRETRLSISPSPSKVDYGIYECWTVAGANRCVSVFSRGTGANAEQTLTGATVGC